MLKEQMKLARELEKGQLELVEQMKLARAVKKEQLVLLGELGLASKWHHISVQGPKNERLSTPSRRKPAPTPADSWNRQPCRDQRPGNQSQWRCKAQQRGKWRP